MWPQNRKKLPLVMHAAGQRKRPPVYLSGGLLKPSESGTPQLAYPVLLSANSCSCVAHGERPPKLVAGESVAAPCQIPESSIQTVFSRNVQHTHRRCRSQ